MKDMEIFARQMEQLREGKINLQRTSDGRTVWSEEPLCELRRYIKALEAGYDARGEQLKFFESIKKVSLVEMRELMERDKPKKPLDLVHTVVEAEGRDTWSGYCPKCNTLRFEYQAFCSSCGQRLGWPKIQTGGQIARATEERTAARVAHTGGQIARATDGGDKEC